MKQRSVHNMKFVPPTSLKCHSTTTKRNIRVDFYETDSECKFTTPPFLQYHCVHLSVMNATVDSGICAWVMQRVNPSFALHILDYYLGPVRRNIWKY